MKDSTTRAPEHREAVNRAQVEQGIMGYADRIVAATPLDRAQLMNMYQVQEAKIVVIPCGVNRELFHPIAQSEAREKIHVPANKRLILFVGRLDPVKGLSFLLRALCDLRDMNPGLTKNLCLAIIGGDRESHLQSLVDDVDCIARMKQQYEQDDIVVFYGAQTQEVLPGYYSASDVCVMPSLYESFGMVALEAMACGIPVIASRVGGLTFTVRDGETGFLVPERNSKALADKLNLVLTDECLRQRLGHRASQVSLGYSWDIVADQLEALYAELGV